MREFFTRRIGPAPLWLWFVVFVFGVAIFLRWRASKTPATKDTSKNSDASYSGPFVTGQSMMLPWSQDIFVNVQQPTGPGPRDNYPQRRGPHMPTPPERGTVPPPRPVPTPTPRPDPAPSPPVPTPTPPPRQQSITYEIKSGDTLWGIGQLFGMAWESIYQANQSLIEAVARQHGFSSSDSGHWIFGGTQLVIPQ